MTRDTRRGDHMITRENLWNVVRTKRGWGQLCRLARFMGIPYPGQGTPEAKWSLVERLFALTRCGKSDKRRAA